ncbi:jg9255 [Pararge aegeria aegeria]|uniref:Jg9255 protein n=1 Tax=Pararge aegeria aegeria TaxID=348720 RepID=A0A8S4SJ56_9NEOP|nr:jg9255 [Pararge aegeria aegeria]
MGLIRRLRVTQRALERAMLRISLRDQIRNRHQSYRHSSTSCKAEVAMGGVHTSEERWGPKVLEWQPHSGIKLFAVTVCNNGMVHSILVQCRLRAKFETVLAATPQDSYRLSISVIICTPSYI